MSNINASKFQEMVQAAASRLNEQAEYVNSLNVFPVPDGDTGTNMGMTITNGAKDVASKPADTVGQVAQILSKGLLMGARGNSGVILSQLFRGFAQYVKDYEEIDGIHLAAALQNGVEVAYKAVMKPVEGTILTVSRGAAELAKRKTDETDDAVEIMEAALEGAKKALAMTPDMLPVLKEVGVVDSGGQGLVYIYEGFLMALNGEFVPETPVAELGAMDRMVNVEHESVANASTADIKFGYCTEIMVELGKGPTSRESYDHDNFQAYLAGIGNSLLVVDDEEVVKVHVHTEDPGLVMQEGLKYGRLVKVKVDNMRLQNEGVAEKEAKSTNVSTSTSKKDWGLIAIAAGEGLADIFREMGVNHVVSGGQTMNPSTEDFVSAIKKVNARHIFILPNNSNIIMAAQQAASVSEGKDIIVLPTKSVPQGLAACISFNPEGTVEENSADMKAAIEHVKTGSITYAIKDTTVDGREIHAGDYMGILEKDIVVTSKEKIESACELIKQMCDEDSEIVTLIRGEDATDEEFEAIQKFIEENYEVDIDAEDGKQPVYSFIIGVE